MAKLNRETLTKPRVTPMAGKRKATERYCQKCKKWHKTFRHIDGKEICPEDYQTMSERL